MESGRSSGGILRLLEIYGEFPAEFTYDFRSRFNLGFKDIGVKIDYLEAIYLLSILLKDTGSWLQAAYSNWDYPVSREWIVASHQYELQVALNAKKGSKPKPYPAPWPDNGAKKLGKTKATRAEVEARLNSMNPKE